MDTPYARLSDEPLPAGRCQEFRQLSATGYLSLDRRGCITYVSPTAGELFGSNRAELLGTRLADLLVEEGGRKELARFVECSSPMTRRRLEFVAVQSESRAFSAQIDIAISPSGKECEIAIVDLLDHKKALEELESTGHLSEHIIADAHEGIVVYDRAGRYRVWNPYMATMTGIPAEHVLGRTPTEVLPFLESTGIVERVRAAAQGQTLPPIDLHFQIPGGGPSLWVSDRTAPLHDRIGDIVGVVTLVRDITERKVAEIALAGEVDRRRVLFDQAPDGMVVLDPANGRILEFNDAACRTAGYTREEFACLRVADLEAVETTQQTRARIDEAVRTGTAEFETVHRTKQGTLRDIAVTVRVFDVQGRSVYFCMWRDITRQKEMERRLLQSQKMDAIGQLAGGMAHDFRNQLTVIKGFGEMLQRRGLVNDNGKEMLQEILKAAERSTLLTGQLLAFSRKQVLEVQDVDLGELIKDIGKAVLRMVGEDIRVDIAVGPGPKEARLDPGQLQQAVFNLVANARDAMPDGGELTIEVYGEVCPETTLKGRRDGMDWCAVVKVTDSGHGMDDHVQAKLFEPFFTTKEVGRGTGLGLAMVYGFVQQSGGQIDVWSRPGQGSRFTMRFPISTGKRAKLKQASPRPRVVAANGQTILLTEDEESVRKMMAATLRESGYSVLEAPGVREAMAVIVQRNGAIDLLITDVVMPGGSGLDLASQARVEFPDIPVLFMSGYADGELSRRRMTLDPETLLAKPCSARVLLEKVQSVLNQKLR